ncbi:sigma-54 interaction domain-containing protein [Bacillus kwashiorkori]|uniref:sigma-54 interaction domain-containing protein n=1 Tax=Bacillus kwashiorkori TaxID=1522318 RepID=UPI00078132B6|nr:sigma 54-interacting transcriptional regulator [Bacillus kwashiorkori]
MRRINWEQILETVLNTIDEGIHIIDLEGNTIFYNQIAARHDGLSREDVLGRHLLSAFPSLTKQTSTLLKVLETKKPIYHQTQNYRNLYGIPIETVNTTLPIIVDHQIVGAVEIAKDYSKLRQLADQLVELQRKDTQHPRNKQSQKYTFSNIITTDDKLIELKSKISKVAKLNSSILVYGESGVGKELFVQGIHEASTRKNKPFIAQNCAALPETLLESILFGTAKGSYTGAVDRPGLFELADGGTLFLDELHCMALDLQAKLLRILEDGVVRRIGDVKERKVDVRVIAAMNISPVKALKTNVIRHDLYYRLNVLAFEIPPLRMRKKDIKILVKFFLKQYNQRFQKRVTDICEKVEDVFTKYDWPGNIRELKHTIEYAMNFCEGNKILLEHLPLTLQDLYGTEDTHESGNNVEKVVQHGLKEYIESIEKQIIIDMLYKTDGNIQKAANQLQLPRQTLQTKLKKYKINKALILKSRATQHA